MKEFLPDLPEVREDDIRYQPSQSHRYSISLFGDRLVPQLPQLVLCGTSKLSGLCASASFNATLSPGVLRVHRFWYGSCVDLHEITKINSCPVTVWRSPDGREQSSARGIAWEEDG